MKITLTKILVVSALLFSFTMYGQNTILSEDLNMLLGEWTGSLTYMDYSSNKPYTMPANVRVEQGKNEKQLLLFITYPNEPNANSRNKITVSKNGLQLNKKEVTSKQIMPNQQVKITTEYEGKDNNQKALIKNIYLLGKNEFLIRKEVKFESSEDWLIRNEYKYTR